MNHKKLWKSKPCRCDNCGSKRIACTDNKVLYGKNQGKWPVIWYCYDCKAAVSCHPDSQIPMGKMATQAVRSLRRKAHKVFDKIFKKHYMTRTDAYAWLANNMSIPRNECHISNFDEKQCELVIYLARQYLSLRKKKPVTISHLKGRKVVRRGHRRKPRCG